MCGRTAVALLVLMPLATPSDAEQDGPLYAGAALTAFTQTHSDTQPRIENGIAGVLGLDAPVKIAPNIYLLPTFRVLLDFGSVADSSDLSDPLGEQTSAGSVLFRYGAGARVTF